MMDPMPRDESHSYSVGGLFAFLTSTAVSCKIQLEVLIVYPDPLCCRQPAGRWSHGVFMWHCLFVCSACVCVCFSV